MATNYLTLTWSPVVTELKAMVERLEELADWANDEDAKAVSHKLEEAMGRLQNAVAAAAQYQVGLLPEPNWGTPLDVHCRDCASAESKPCSEGGSSDLMLPGQSGSRVHRLRYTDWSDRKSRTLRELHLASEALQ